MNPVWSPDSRWIAYARRLDNQFRAIFVYSVETGRTEQVTDGMSDATWPAWDASGKYLYFLASTNYGLNTGWLDMSSLRPASDPRVYLAVLRKGEPSPLLPESDEEGAAPARAGAGAGAGPASGATDTTRDAAAGGTRAACCRGERRHRLRRDPAADHLAGRGAPQLLAAACGRSGHHLLRRDRAGQRRGQQSGGAGHTAPLPDEGPRGKDVPGERAGLHRLGGRLEAALPLAGPGRRRLGHSRPRSGRRRPQARAGSMCRPCACWSIRGPNGARSSTRAGGSSGTFSTSITCTAPTTSPRRRSTRRSSSTSATAPT
jgi:hypothetical protein